MGANIFSEKHQITYETDVTNTWHRDAGQHDYFGIEDQTDSLGVGAESVAKLGIGWVVTQYKMDITDCPRWGRPLTIDSGDLL